MYTLRTTHTHATSQSPYDIETDNERYYSVLMLHFVCESLDQSLLPCASLLLLLPRSLSFLSIVCNLSVGRREAIKVSNKCGLEDIKWKGTGRQIDNLRESHMHMKRIKRYATRNNIGCGGKGRKRRRNQ